VDWVNGKWAKTREETGRSLLDGFLWGKHVDFMWREGAS